MKLGRYGKARKEKLGLIDAAGKSRDRRGIVADVDADTLSPRALARVVRLKPESLPAVRGTPRIGACLAWAGKFIAVGLNTADHAGRSGPTPPSEPGDTAPPGVHGLGRQARRLAAYERQTGVAA